MATDTLARIGNLLRQAESTNFEAEADAFYAAAQRLATAAQVDLEVARAHVTNGERRATPEQRRIVIGDRGRVGNATLVALFHAIGEPNNVTNDIAHDSTAVYAFGFSDDIDLVEALFASLSVQMVKAADQFIRSGAHRAELADTGYWGEAKPVHGRTARVAFQRAFARRIAQRLRSAKQEAIASLDADAPAAQVTGAELVLVGRQAAVRDYYKATSTARGSYRGFSRQARSRIAAEAGRAAGDRARLGTEKAIGTSRPALAR